MSKAGAAESASMNRPGSDSGQRVLQDLSNAIKGKAPESTQSKVDDRQNCIVSLNKALGKSNVESVV